MTPVLIAAVAFLLVAVAALTMLRVRDRNRRARTLRSSPKRILFPFLGRRLSRRGLDAALRLARTDGATLVPIYLAQVSMRLPLDAALPRQCGEALPLLEAIEHRATTLDVPVDSRIERGRNVRHALRHAIDHETYDRIVIAASPRGTPGFDPGDIAWLLDNAPGEIVVLRPAHDDQLELSRTQTAALNGANGASGVGREPVRPPADLTRT